MVQSGILKLTAILMQYRIVAICVAVLTTNSRQHSFGLGDADSSLESSAMITRVQSTHTIDDSDASPRHTSDCT